MTITKLQSIAIARIVSDIRTRFNAKTKIDTTVTDSGVLSVIAEINPIPGQPLVAHPAAQVFAVSRRGKVSTLDLSGNVVPL